MIAYRMKLTLQLAIALIAFFSNGAALATDYERFTKYATHNSDLWFNYGPAIIGCAKCICLVDVRKPISDKDPRYAKGMRFDDPKDYWVSEGDPNFLAVKHWISVNFADKINFSENTPAPPVARLGEKVLILYAERTAPLAKEHQALLLITIPISPKTLCLDKPLAEETYRQLKALMGVPAHGEAPGVK
jgi:hypothetical protein